MSSMEDEDGIDGPFEKAMDADKPRRPVKRDARITFAIEPELKAQCKAKAKADGLDLAVWIRQAMRRALVEE